MKIPSLKKSTLALAIGATSMFAADMAMSQALLEEVIVTATRRSQSVQEIAFNISAISGTEIEAANIIDAQELLRAIPGVVVPDGGARLAENNNGIAIRGLNLDPAATDRAFLSDPTVSTYVGNTPIFANFILKDIERVEVLRGPQGTLYGSGSLGGTVRYIMKKPSTEAVSGKIEASYGQTDGSDGNNYSFDAMINVPLGDTAAFRLSLGRIDNAGVVDSVNLYQTRPDGVPVAQGGDFANGLPVYVNNKDADTVEIDYVRASVLWEPTDNLEMLLSYQKQEGDYGGRRQTTSSPNGYGEEYGEYEIGAVVAEPASNSAEFTSLEIEYEMGFATLSSSTSSYDRTYDGISDNTGFTAAQGWLVFYSYGMMPRPAVEASRHNEEKAFIQEFRLVSSGDNTVDWVLGAYYKDQEGSANQETLYLGHGEWNESIGNYFYWMNPESDATFDWTYENEFTDMALFGEVTWHATDAVDLSIGARSFKNENTVTSQTSFPIWYSYGPVVTETNKDSDTLFKLNGSWTLSDESMLYGTISEGYRRGGTNATPVYPDPDYPNDPEWGSFDKDTVINYEIGLKGQMDSLTYTVALFYVDWQDPQLNVATPSGAYYAVQNGSAAETKGLESEFNWAATESIRLFGGYTYVNAELTEDLMLHDANPDTDGKTELRATSGAVLPGTPEHTINLGASHTAAFSNGLELISRIDFYSQSEVENSILNIDENWAATLEGFQLWNLSFTLRGESWSASLYAKNLANEKGVTATYKDEYMTSDPSQNFYGTGQKDFITTPRTVSLSASYSF
ncbi:MAG: TonB-dependent receptor [Pseudomonadales bacterium]